MEQLLQAQVPANLEVPVDHDMGPTSCSQTFRLGRREDPAKYWHPENIAGLDISSSMPAEVARSCSLHDQHNMRHNIGDCP